MDKKDRIKKEINYWNKILKDVSDERKKGALKLIEQVAFMQVTLQELQEAINVEGPIYLFKNGKQEMIIENPAQKSYNTMINRYTTAVDKLMSYLPKEMAKEVDDGFMAFVRERE